MNLVQAIATNLSETFGEIPEWDALAIVLRFDGTRFSGNHGYVYVSDGSWDAVASKMPRIREVVNAYMSDKYPDGAPYPVDVLVQFDRVKGRYAFHFEYSDKSRWKVTPKTFKEIPEKVRPSFED